MDDYIYIGSKRKSERLLVRQDTKTKLLETMIDGEYVNIATDYNEATNKPSINEVVLEGELTSEDLDLVTNTEMNEYLSWQPIGD